MQIMSNGHQEFQQPCHPYMYIRVWNHCDARHCIMLHDNTEFYHCRRLNTPPYLMCAFLSVSSSLRNHSIVAVRHYLKSPLPRNNPACALNKYRINFVVGNKCKNSQYHFIFDHKSSYATSCRLYSRRGPVIYLPWRSWSAWRRITLHNTGR